VTNEEWYAILLTNVSNISRRRIVREGYEMYPVAEREKNPEAKVLAFWEFLTWCQGKIM